LAQFLIAVAASPVVAATKISHPAVGRTAFGEVGMATGLFGVSWTEIIDFLLKLAPAASIVGGILAARVQLRSNRQINAVMIAKNHYREMLDAFLKNSDILY
jgi:hypothetical protein